MSRKIYLLFFLLILIPCFKLINSLTEVKKTTIDVFVEKKYHSEQTNVPTLHARTLMIKATQLAQEKKLNQIESAQLLAYTASIYDDILKKTSSEPQACVGTEIFISNIIAVKNTTLCDDKTPTVPDTQNIIALYKKKVESDNFNTKTKNWQPWIIVQDEKIPLLASTIPGSFQDRVEIAKLKYSTTHRSNTDFFSIYFWAGVKGFQKEIEKEKTPLAGLWQSIFFVEKGESLSHQEYSSYQKMIAQTIADTFIQTEKIQQIYTVQQPSTRIPNLSVVYNDSSSLEYASVSFAANTLLSYHFPDKKRVFHTLADSAGKSRILAGLNFENDIQVGNYVGEFLAKRIIQTTDKNATIISSLMPRRNTAVIFSQFLLLPIQYFITDNLKPFINKLVSRQNFSDRILESNIQPLASSTGAAWGDYNKDGFLDLLLTGNTIKLYKNNTDGTFSDITKEIGLEPGRYALQKTNTKTLHSNIGMFVDYDNDGCLDIFIGPLEKGSSEAFKPNLKPILYRNNCKNRFFDMTQKSGIYNTWHGRGAAWADYNNDGFLDLYIGNWGLVFEPNFLYRNNRDGTFKNVTALTQVTGIAECGHESQSNSKITYQPLWFDYNDDRLPDLFVATDIGVSPLYRNNGDGTFTDVTREAGLCRFGTGMGVTVGDYDIDGNIDLFVTNFTFNYLWRNNGSGTFTEVGEHSPLTRYSVGYGTEFIDYNNDSNLDLYVANGSVDVGDLLPELFEDNLYQGDGKGNFIEVTQQENFSARHAKEALALADYNNDGFEDLLVTSGYLVDNPIYHLYTSKKTSNHWITIQLIGNESNIDGIGAQIVVTTPGKKQIRQITSGSSYISQRSPWQTFGLGKALYVDTLEIHWPSGIIQTLHNVASNQKIIVHEALN